MEQNPSFFKNWIILWRYRRLEKRVKRLTKVPSSLTRKALAVEGKLLEEQINNKLSHTPAEVLRQYRTGARIQPISHYSIKRIKEMTANQIASVHGVGKSSAIAIKNCADKYIDAVRQSERIQLSSDNRTANASKLVKKVYQIDKLNELAQEGLDLEEKSLGNKKVVKKARIAAHPLLWFFSKDKETALKSVDEIQQLLQSPLVIAIQELEGKRSSIMKAEHNVYWAAFRADPARFYSVLEESGSRKRNRRRRSEDKSYLDIFNQELRQQIEHVEIKTDGLRCVLRPYQKFGVKYILNQGNVLLGDEMGLGKTIEAIGTMVSLRNSGDTHFVVVCPASVLINWKREINRHSDLKCYILHGSEFYENLSRWEASGGVAITNYENTARFKCDNTIALTVVDEAHYIKNHSAARTINTIKIMNHSRRRLLMTGTPLENKLEEMVALISLLQPEIVKKVYALPQPVDRYAFMRVVAPVYFRRTKDAVWREMPELQIVEDAVELSPAERKLYIECVRKRNMAAFTIMRQISFEVDNASDSSKLRRIREICNEAFDNGRKVIIFSFYLDTIEMIHNSLRSAVYGPITGSISPQRRQQIIDDFSNHPGGAVLLSQILAGGTGLNIQQASIVIMCEPQYKPSTENQAIARAYRIGQTSNVVVYRLLGERTVDERILQILKEKQAVFDLYANKSESGEESIRLSEKEIAEAEFRNCAVS